MSIFAALAAPRFRFLWAALSLAFILICFGLFKTPDPIAFRDTDEAMRLVQLRAFLAGQAWLDLVPHRLDPSVDVPMHWSRFVDLSMVALYKPLALFLTQPNAERAMAIIWPSFMLIICAIPLAFIARRFGGNSAALIAVLLLAGVKTTVEFMPGRIDHHSAQMATALVAIAATMARNRPRIAALAGFATAFALSLGIETIPYLVILACFFATDFVRGVRSKSVRAYSAALTCSALGLFLITTEPRFYFYTACDALTLNVLAAIAGGGALLGAAARLCENHETSTQQRFISLVLIGSVAIAFSLALEPRCLGGVIGTFDPAIRPLWFDQIQEIASIVKITIRRPEIAIPGMIFPALAVVIVATQWRKLASRDDMQIVTACFVVAVLVMVFQIRGAFYANMFALPFIAMGVAQFHRKYAMLRSLQTGPVLVSLALGFLTYAMSFAALHLRANPITPPVEAAVSSPSQATSQDMECQTKSSLQELARLRPGLVLSVVDLGSYIMLETPHSVVSAPYHRFDRGIVLGQSILYTMDLKQAEAAIRQRGIDYVALCRDGKWPTVEEVFIKTKHDWLREVSTPNAQMVVLQVVPRATAAKSP